ncbi:DUF4365 domain-containing protein [Cupriavidus necator]|uniref:DUF4365 domain-containing protein n=1 Tax=Cupriavidus necator TaxID=106590 RepID=UPI003ECC64B5
MKEDTFNFDVFITHSEQDADAARKIAGNLRAAGLMVWNREPMARSTAATSSYDVRSGLEQSRVLLLLISAGAAAEGWTSFDGQALRFRDPANIARRFVPVRLDDTPLPEALKSVESLAWPPEKGTEILQKLVAICKPPQRARTSRGQVVNRSSHNKRYRIEPQSSLSAAAFDSSISNAAYGTRDGVVLIIGVEQPNLPVKRMLGHRGAVRTLCFNESNSRVVSTGVDRTARLWDVTTGSCLHTYDKEQQGVNTAIFVESNVALGGKSTTIQIYDEAGVASKIFRGHTGEVLALQVSGHRLISASADQTIRVWDLRTGQCLRVLEGHTAEVRSLSLSAKGNLLLSGSGDRTIRMWDCSTGLCLQTFDAHTDAIQTLAWHPLDHLIVSGGADRTLRMWSAETGKLLRIMEGNESDARALAISAHSMLALDANTLCQWSLDRSLLPSKESRIAASSTSTPENQVQYTNAKVLLVGDSGAGKTGLSKRLAHGDWEPSAASTVGAWATQWSIPTSGSDSGEREIWLWDFGGQADQRLIHQLYMNETALAVLVFDAQKSDAFESINQWNRDLSRSRDESFSKLLVAGRIDASPVRVSQQDIDACVTENGFVGYVETSALTNKGCDELRKAIVDSIDWSQIPWRSSPVLFKRLKEQIVKLKDDGRVLMRFNELRDALKLRLPAREANFTDIELKAVLSLLSGPGVIVELEFGAWILFQPELINAYSQAVIATMRADPSELGCVSEEKVLSGDLLYGGFSRISPGDERIVLLEMHRKLLRNGLCARETTEKDVLLVFPSYYKRNRPELTGHPTVIVSYIFSGIVDEIYSTLVVRLEHTHEFERAQLWRDAAEFYTRRSGRIGIKLTRSVERGRSKIEVYCDNEVMLAEKIIFLKYVHNHLSIRDSGVSRYRHYSCSNCQHSLVDFEAIVKRRSLNKHDIGCPACDNRVPLMDELEEMYGSPEFQRKIQRLEGIATKELDNESKDRLLVGEMTSAFALANQISREKSVSDHGIDMEVEFKHDDGTASGKMLFLQLKSGDSYTRETKDGKEIFTIKKERHAKYWAEQIAPVMLVIRNSSGEIRWMEIRKYLNDRKKDNKFVNKIEFSGEPLDSQSIMKWRNTILNG